MKSGFWSLIVSCLHSLQFSRKVQNVKRYFDQSLQSTSDALLPEPEQEPKPNQSAPLFLLREGENGGGICNGKFMSVVDNF